MGKTNHASAHRRLAACLVLSAATTAPLSAAALAAPPVPDDPPTGDAAEAPDERTAAPDPRRYLDRPFVGELEDNARQALERWGPWAAERGYVGRLSRQQSTLVFTLERRSEGDELRVVERVENALSELLPVPRTRNRGPITRTGGPTSPTYPIGGDEPIYRVGLDGVDAHTAVLFELDTDRHLEEFEQRLDELTEPSTGPRRHLGEPSTSVLTADAAAYVWRVGACPDPHQVAFAAAQFVLERRFPHQPAWLRDGLAWHAEREVLGAVRCLPDGRGASSTDFAELWHTRERTNPFRGTWLDRLEHLFAAEPTPEDAGLAYGLVADLLERPPQDLANACERLRLYWESHAVRYEPGQGLVRRWDYRTPVFVQGRELEELLDAADLARAD